MSRAWKQYDLASASWVDWPAGTLPSAESVFRAAFLNQFIAWQNYLTQLTQGFAADSLVSIGDPIQSHSFWNKILGYANAAPSLWKNPVAHEIGVVIPDPHSVLAADAAYIAAQDQPIGGIYWPSSGDIIHPLQSAACPMRTRLLKARTRLDLMRNTPATVDADVSMLDRWIHSVKYPWMDEYVRMEWNTGAALTLIGDTIYGGDAVRYYQTAGQSPYVERVVKIDLPASVHFGYSTFGAASYIAAGGSILFADNGEHPAFMPTDLIEDMPEDKVTMFSGARYTRSTPDYPPLGATSSRNCGLAYYAFLHPLDVLPSVYTPAEYPFPT